MVVDPQHGGNGRGRPVPSKPLPKGAKGDRNSQGQFEKGHGAPGPGNPYARHVARIRSLILEAVSDDDLKDIVQALVEKAKGGDVIAVRELLNRLVGRPTDAVDLDRQELEQKKTELASRRLEMQEDLQDEKLFSS